MPRIGRRRLLQLSGAGAIAAKSGGIAAILALGQAPAYAQGSTLHWLRWNDFVPASDGVLRQEIIPACEKALGIKLNIEMINGNDIQARTTAAIQSGSGADVICGLNNWPQLYAESVTDVTDVAEAVGKAQGGFYDESRMVANDGKKWIAVPWCVLGAQIAYRKSWLEEAGYSKFPETWEEYRGAGKKVEADGKTVVLNSKAAVDSVRFMTAFWKDAHDDGGLAWDDSSNNRAFLAGTICATLNGASIYLEAKRKPDTYMTEKGTPLWQDILHAPLPKGAAGQFGYHLPMSNMLMAYSRNQKPAKEFLRWITSKEVYQTWFDSQQGYSVGATTIWEEDPLWKKDPVMLPFRSAARAGRFPGYAGPADRKAAEVLSKYIIIDTYAKAVQGMPAEDAVKWAHEEVTKIHA